MYHRREGRQVKNLSNRHKKKQTTQVVIRRVNKLNQNISE